jgi:hypothetical protein
LTRRLNVSSGATVRAVVHSGELLTTVLR